MGHGKGGMSGVGGGGVGSGGEWAVRGGLYLVSTVQSSYESKKCQLQAQTCPEGLREVSHTLGSISDLCLPSSANHGPHCLSHDFTWLAKLTLEKQTS